MSDFSKRAERDKIHFALVETKFGWIGLVSREGRLLYLFKPEESKDACMSQTVWGAGQYATEAPEAFGDLPDRLRSYFDGEKVDFQDIAIDLDGYTEFQAKLILQARTIPYGKVATYAELARAAGTTNAARAAGQAMTRNKTPIIVPCHRVVRSDGRAGGFAWGQHWKLALLEIEGIPTSVQTCKREHTTLAKSWRSRTKAGELC